MLTLPAVMRLNARRAPGRAAVVDERHRLTHAELAERANALARGLLRLGLESGDRVAVLSGNSCFAVETLLGSTAAGGVYVALNWRWATPELLDAIALTRPRVLLVEERFRAAAARAIEQGLASGRLPEGLIVRHEGEDDRSLLAAGGAVDVSVRLDDAMCILFTGGTTGRSKGVVLTHRAALTNALNELADCGLGAPPFNTTLAVTPLFHSAALLCVFLPHYVTAGTCVAVHRFEEDAFADLVERERVNTTFLIPNMVRRLERAGSFSAPGVRANLKQLHSGGGPFRRPDKEAIRAAAPELSLFYRYGLTEAGPMVSRLLPGDMFAPDLDGSIGQAYSLTEVELQDLDGRPVPPGELGEICVRGPNLMDGYFEDPDATGEALRGGWLHTGDLAVRDADGYLFFRDRAKDMIKSGGENVYAAEIEQLLYAHPAVMECGVLGVASEDWGEEVRAVVALRTPDAATREELEAHLRCSLAAYKIPKVFAFTDPATMPVNPSGKIVKSRLRSLMGW